MKYRYKSKAPAELYFAQYIDKSLDPAWVKAQIDKIRRSRPMLPVDRQDATDADGGTR